MTPKRVRDFSVQMVAAGLYHPGDVDLDRVASYQFVNRWGGWRERASRLRRPRKGTEDASMHRVSWGAWRHTGRFDDPGTPAIVIAA